MSKFVRQFVTLTIIAGLALAMCLPLGTKASWPDAGVMGTTMMDEGLQEFVWSEIKAIIIDVLKKKAMDIFRKQVLKRIGEQGGIVSNFGEYLYASGDNAAAKYWNSFLSNCTNIDTTVSLAVRYEAVDRGNSYDWCPVKVNARGVDLGEITISEEHGWEDFADLVSYNDPYQIFFKSVNQVEEARQKQEEVQKMQALSTGTKPTTSGEADGSADSTTTTTTSADGSTEIPAESQEQDIDVIANQYLSAMNAATEGTFQVQANVRGFLSAAISLALNYYIDEVLSDTAFGEYKE